MPLENLGPDKILELFRGPTAAFKDMALQLTPQFFTEATQSSGEKNLILAATSGDTGVAAISGYKKKPNTKVLVLFPEHGVSSVQKKQMLAEQSDRVQVVGLNEDFDYCQATVKNCLPILSFLNCCTRKIKPFSVLQIVLTGVDCYLRLFIMLGVL